MITFFVPGIPRPGGSKRAFVIPGTNRACITEDCKKSRDWRAAVGWAASERIKEPLAGPLEVRFSFLIPRPKGHYGSGKNAGQVKASAPAHPAVKPDITKLIRSTEDAMKGIAWLDDNQVVFQLARKLYTSGQPGATIQITKMGKV